MTQKKIGKSRNSLWFHRILVFNLAQNVSVIFQYLNFRNKNSNSIMSRYSDTFCSSSLRVSVKTEKKNVI